MTDALAQRLCDRFRLLVDLLQHERLVAAALRLLVVPVELLDRRLLDLGALDEEARALGCDGDDLTVVGKDRAPRLAEKRRDIRGEEALPVPEADDERRLVAHADEALRLVVVYRDDREMPLEERVDLADRRSQVAVVDTLEQVDDHLRVRLRGEGVALGQELLFQLP